ncbi:MAG TPA: hypothetical protein VGU90_17335, partial [Terriglobales bacterium]|nr:hypothetical protein [Terriglobales bacterium]
MTVGKVLVTGLKILAVCLVFASCFIVGGMLSGLNKIGQQASPSKTVEQVPPAQQAISSTPEARTTAQPPQMPENFLRTFLTFSVCVGLVLSYLILRSTCHGWSLVAAISVGIYGVSTVVAQIESVFFLSNKLPRGMIPAIFLQGGIATALFAPLAVLLLGKWRAASQTPASPALARMRAPSAAWRLALIVVAFVFLYMFFGYYVAWQSPAVRQYYGGPEQSSFYAALKANWMYHPWIYPLQVFRALLYVACLYPLIRMLRAARWETALAMAFFLSSWTTALLLPN